MLSLADSMGPAENTAGLYVRFTKVPKEDAQRSLAEGRPVFNDIDYITIAVPGDKSSEVCRPVTPDDRERFRAAFERYTAGQGEVAMGLPLKEWPGATRAQVEELSYFKVHTVEQLAEVTDANLPKMGLLLALRQRARDYLERSSKDAPVRRMQEELAARDEQLAKLQAQVDALMSQQEKPRRRKSPVEAEVEAAPEVRPLTESEVAA